MRSHFSNSDTVSVFYFLRRSFRRIVSLSVCRSHLALLSFYNYDLFCHNYDSTLKIWSLTDPHNSIISSIFVLTFSVLFFLLIPFLLSVCLFFCLPLYLLLVFSFVSFLVFFFVSMSMHLCDCLNVCICVSLPFCRRFMDSLSFFYVLSFFISARSNI